MTFSSWMLVVFDPATRIVKRVVIPEGDERIHASHLGPGETATFVPMGEQFSDPFDHQAFVDGLAPYGLVFP